MSEGIEIFDGIHFQNWIASRDRRLKIGQDVFREEVDYVDMWINSSGAMLDYDVCYSNVAPICSKHGTYAYLCSTTLSGNGCEKEDSGVFILPVSIWVRSVLLEEVLNIA